MSVQGENSNLRETEAESRLVEPRRTLSPLVAIAALAAGGLLVGTLFWPRSGAESPEVFPAQTAQTEGEYRSPPVLPMEAAPEIAAPVNDYADELARERQLRLDAEEAQRRAEEEARAAIEAEMRAQQQREDQQRWERLRSPMIVSETSDIDISVPEIPGSNGAAASTFEATNAASQFLNSRASMTVEVAKAQPMARPDAMVVQGTIIHGVLETALNSDLPGMVRAVTVEDVWSYDGRRILVPTGSRLIGEYDAGLEQGQRRIFVVWTRLLLPNGLSVSLASPGTDALGRSGVAGHLDNHDFERFGAAFLTSIVGAGAQILTAPGVLIPATPAQVTTTRINPVTGQIEQITSRPPEDQSGRLIASGGAALAQGLSGALTEVLRPSMEIGPTITLHQGAPIAVSVRRDLDFSDHYPDPVMEAYRHLQSLAGEEVGGMEFRK